MTSGAIRYFCERLSARVISEVFACFESRSPLLLRPYLTGANLMKMDITRLARRSSLWGWACIMAMLVCCAQTPAPPQNQTQPQTETPSKANISVYTELSGPDCSVVRSNNETGASVDRCKGTAGWDLLVQSDDQRMSIAVVRPDGSEHPLNFWDVITPGFSSLGPRAEWRVQPTGNGNSGEPLALIVRVNASEQQQTGGNKTVSYLAVARLQGSTICVTAKIPPAANSNESARQAADTASTAACLPK
jgi:hypothetical protein